MLIRVCMAKIHRATVTEADLNYVGSITIDEDLLEKSGIRPFQMVNITNISNGVLWQTYVMAGKKGRGGICLNGPPARHFQPGDKIIVIADAYIEPSELKDLNPVVIFVDDKNRITKIKKHKALHEVNEAERPKNFGKPSLGNRKTLCHIPVARLSCSAPRNS